MFVTFLWVICDIHFVGILVWETEVKKSVISWIQFENRRYTYEIQVLINGIYQKTNMSASNAVFK